MVKPLAILERTSFVDRALLEETLLARGASEVAGVVGVSLGGYRALALASGGRVKVRAVVTLRGFSELSDEERAMMMAIMRVS